jgi:hypothetical protein
MYVKLVEVKLVLLLAHKLFSLLSLLLIFYLSLEIFKVLLLVGYLATLIKHASKSAICELLGVYSFFFGFDFIFDADLLVEDLTHL